MKLIIVIMIIALFSLTADLAGAERRISKLEERIKKLEEKIKWH